MELTFFGAAGEVTGSSTLVRTPHARVLVDLGLHQGGPNAEARNRRTPPLDGIDAVVLTHAHVDHCGRLPLLFRAGYRGPIFSTPASIELAGILLRDAAYLQEVEAERLNRHRERQGRTPATPLYTVGDAEQVLGLFRPLRYAEWREIAPGIRVRLHDAGHIIGSAMVEMAAEESGGSKIIVFSGDLGPRGTPMLRDPATLNHADLVVLESTYGDRDHRPRAATVEELAEILASARTPAGKVLIPAFAVGRTQQLIHEIGNLLRSERIRPTPVFIDSPMAIEATNLYRRHRELFDDEAARSAANGEPPLLFPGLAFIKSARESQTLNQVGGGAVVIAASGMCTGGRILHHLRHGLWRPECRVVIVGFQSAGSLGRKLVEGHRQVRVMGETIAVRASIHTLGGFSAHAERSELLQWGLNFADAKPRFLMNHGEDKPRHALGEELARRGGFRVDYPEWYQTVRL